MTERHFPTHEAIDDQLYGMPLDTELSGDVYEDTMTAPAPEPHLTARERDLLLNHAAEMEDWDTFDKLQAITPDTPDPRINIDQ